MASTAKPATRPSARPIAPQPTPASVQPSAVSTATAPGPMAASPTATAMFTSGYSHPPLLAHGPLPA